MDAGGTSAHQRLLSRSGSRGARPGSATIAAWATERRAIETAKDGTAPHIVRGPPQRSRLTKERKEPRMLLADYTPDEGEADWLIYAGARRSGGGAPARPRRLTPRAPASGAGAARR